MASQEMLRKLLDDFVEKEALVQEELKVIVEQIDELERRLELCRSRLSTIGTDRDRVLQIRGRYADGTFYSPSQIGEYVAPQPAPKVEKKASKPEVKPEPKAEPKPEPAPEPKVDTKPHIEAASPRSTQSGIQAIVSGRRSQQAEPMTQPEPIAQPEPVAQPEPAPAVAPQNDFWQTPQPQVQQQQPPAWQPQEQPAAFQQSAAQADSTPSALAGLSADWGNNQDNGDDGQWELPEQQQEAQAQPLPVQQQAPQPSDDTTTAASEEKNEESDSETVKSINDALRSLFR